MESRISHALFSAFHDRGRIFGYSGGFKDDHTVKLIALGDAVLGNLSRSERTRLGFVMVEAYQNIIRHRATVPAYMERGAGRSLFVLAVQEGGQQVLATNPVRKDQVADLRQQLGRLVGLGRDELKDMFIRGIQRAQHPEKRGAGLGLIEMTRRSGSELGYLLRGLGEEQELFAIVVKLGHAAEMVNILGLNAILHGTVVQHDIAFFHVGAVAPGQCQALGDLLAAEDADMGTRAAPVSVGVARTIMALVGPDMPFVVLCRGRDADLHVEGGALLPPAAVGTARGLCEGTGAAATAWQALCALPGAAPVLEFAEQADGTYMSIISPAAGQ